MLVGPLVELEALAAVDQVSRAELRCGRGCFNWGVGVAESVVGALISARTDAVRGQRPSP